MNAHVKKKLNSPPTTMGATIPDNSLGIVREDDAFE